MTALAYIALLAAAFGYFILRGYWLTHQADRHSALVTYYCLTTRQGAVMADELTRVWPGALVLLDYPWHWDWCRYVIREDLYTDMMEWLAAQDSTVSVRPQ